MEMKTNPAGTPATGLKFGKLLVLAAFALGGVAAQAGPIDVLWLGGSATYNTGISKLAAGGVDDANNYDPDGDGSNSWTITFWNDGTPAPNFSDFDAFVIGSTCEPVGCFSNSFFSLGVQPDNVLANKAGIEAARGDRTFVSGQDADWHYLNDFGLDTDGSTDSADARAFLVNAVNWAAAGSGMGIVVLADGYAPSGAGSTGGWIDDPDSFLAAEIGSARLFEQQEGVIIPVDSAAFPINEGLDSGDLSNWGQSAHTSFVKADLPTGWKSINDSGFAGSTKSITIVTASEADGGTTVPVPEPASLGLLGLSLVALTGLRRRRS